MKNLNFICCQYILLLQNNHYHENNNTIYRHKAPITNLACFRMVKAISLLWNPISSIALYSESLVRIGFFFNAVSFANVL